MSEAPRNACVAGPPPAPLASPDGQGASRVRGLCASQGSTRRTCLLGMMEAAFPPHPSPFVATGSYLFPASSQTPASTHPLLQ